MLSSVPFPEEVLNQSSKVTEWKNISTSLKRVLLKMKPNNTKFQNIRGSILDKYILNQWHKLFLKEVFNFQKVFYQVLQPD